MLHSGGLGYLHAIQVRHPLVGNEAASRLGLVLSWRVRSSQLLVGWQLANARPPAPAQGDAKEMPKRSRTVPDDACQPTARRSRWFLSGHGMSPMGFFWPSFLISQGSHTKKRDITPSLALRRITVRGRSASLRYRGNSHGSILIGPRALLDIDIGFKHHRSRLDQVLASPKPADLS